MYSVMLMAGSLGTELAVWFFFSSAVLSDGSVAILRKVGLVPTSGLKLSKSFKFQCRKDERPIARLISRLYFDIRSCACRSCRIEHQEVGRCTNNFLLYLLESLRAEEPLCFLSDFGMCPQLTHNCHVLRHATSCQRCAPSFKS